jgi:hypothetical protein
MAQSIDAAEGPHAHLRTRESADINVNDEEHGSLSLSSV